MGQRQPSILNEAQFLSDSQWRISSCSVPYSGCWTVSLLSLAGNPGLRGRGRRIESLRAACTPGKDPISKNQTSEQTNNKKKKKKTTLSLLWAQLLKGAFSSFLSSLFQTNSDSPRLNSYRPYTYHLALHPDPLDLITSNLIYSFNKYVLSVCSVPATITDTGQWARCSHRAEPFWCAR